MDAEMPEADLDDLARSARTLQLHAAGPASPMSPPPGIDQQVLAYARDNICSSVALAGPCFRRAYA